MQPSSIVVVCNIDWDAEVQEPPHEVCATLLDGPMKGAVVEQGESGEEGG